jgi:hypothetical protein
LYALECDFQKKLCKLDVLIERFCRSATRFGIGKLKNFLHQAAPN